MSQYVDRDDYNSGELRHRFTNQELLKNLVQEKLRQPAPAPVLMFHGIGGVGKTYLMRYLLYEYGCGWSNKLEDTLRPHAFLCFRPGHTRSDPAGALWDARIQLRQCLKQFAFPRFDLLWAKRWERDHNGMPISSNSTLLSDLPDEIEWFTDIIGLVDDVPFVDLAPKLIKWFGKRCQDVQQFLAKDKLQKWLQEQVTVPPGIKLNALLQIMPSGKLDQLLPIAFAADLAESAAHLPKKYDRVLLLVDNYETFHEQSLTSLRQNTSNFIQTLAEELLRLQANVLIVIAGRDRLRWGQLQHWDDNSWELNTRSIWAQGLICNDLNKFTSTSMEQRLMGALSKADTIGHLRKYQVSDDMAEQVYGFTKGYPLALGLAIELIIEADVQATEEVYQLRSLISGYKSLTLEWTREVNGFLLDRILEQIGFRSGDLRVTMIKAAAVPQWFNQELLCSLINDHNVAEKFDLLVQHSFVEPYQVEGIHAYRLNPVVRELLRGKITNTREQERYRQWNKSAMQWFETQVTKMEENKRWRYQIEALYHRWPLDPQTAAHILEDWFDKVYPEQLALCRVILDTAFDVQHLPLDVQARLKICESRLYDASASKQGQRGAHRELALDAAKEAVTLANRTDQEALKAWAYLHMSHALISVAIGGSYDPDKRFAEAIDMAKKACEAATKAGNDMILASGLCFRASVESDANQEFGNLRLIDQAIRIHARSKDRENLVNAFNIKAYIAMRIGEWKDVEESLTKAEQVNATLQIGLKRRYHDANIHQVWGEYYAQRQQWGEAAERLKQARKVFEELGYLMGICAATGWLGLVQCHLGDMAEGIPLVHEALKIERDVLSSQEGVAKWLHYLGELFQGRNEIERALHAFWLSQSLRETMRHTELQKTRQKLEKIRAVDEDTYNRLRNEFNPRTSEFGEYTALWGLGYLRKYPGNPVLVPQGDGWESRAVFNPATWTDGDKVYLLYRAEGPCSFPNFPEKEVTSRIGLAISIDGKHFERELHPVMEPTEPYEIPGGCEDPRIVRINDTFYMTYTAYDGKVARLAMAVSQDLKMWEKKGLIFTDEQWDQFFPKHKYPDVPKGWFKSGAILSEQVGGRYWMFFGDTDIWAAYSTNLQHWEIVGDPVLTPRAGFFDSRLVEPGPPPQKLGESIWLGYNSADANLHYAFGQVLLDPHDPTKVLRRSARPLLEPTTADEIEGQISNVVFGEGLVEFQGQIFLYYGMADSRIGVAIAESSKRIQ